MVSTLLSGHLFHHVSGNIVIVPSIFVSRMICAGPGSPARCGCAVVGAGLSPPLPTPLRASAPFRMDVYPFVFSYEFPRESLLISLPVSNTEQGWSWLD